MFTYYLSLFKWDPMAEILKAISTFKKLIRASKGACTDAFDISGGKKLNVARFSHSTYIKTTLLCTKVPRYVKMNPLS